MELTAISKQPGIQIAASKSWLVIVNPAAGSRLARGWLTALRERLGHEFQAEVVITRDFQHIAELLRIAGGATDVAVFGGDGTIAEVVNRMSLNRQRLLPLPGGTGNGLARDLGLTSMDRALAAVHANTHQAIDLLEVMFRTRGQNTRRLAVSTAALGYAAKTVAAANRLPHVLGQARYIMASIVGIAQMSASPFVVRLNGGPPQACRLNNIIVNNTQHAGNFHLFRHASPCDGQMDALLASNKFCQQLLYNLALLAYSRLSDTAWAPCRLQTLHLYSSVPTRLMLDGETWDGVNEVSFSVLPERLLCYSW